MLILACALFLAPTAQTAPGEGISGFAARGCVLQSLGVRVPPQLVDHLVPDDFVVDTSQGAAAITMGFVECERVTGAAADGPGAFSWISITVRRPQDPDLQAESIATKHRYLTDLFAGADAFGAALDAVGHPFVPARVHVDLDVLAPSALAQGVAGEFAMESVAAPDLGGATSTRWRYFSPVPGGYATMEVTYERKGSDRNIGPPATGTVPAAHWLGQMLGPHPAGFYAYSHDFSLADGVFDRVRV